MTEGIGDDGTAAGSQGALFHEVSLERHVPDDQLPRAVDPVAAIDPEDAPRAVREYLAVLDDAAFGAAQNLGKLAKLTAPAKAPSPV